MNDLLSQCHRTYRKIQEWRDAPDAFDWQSDRFYLHELLVELQDKARQLGCQIESIHDPTIDQALNAVAFIIEWCKSQDEQQGKHETALAVEVPTCRADPMNSQPTCSDTSALFELLTPTKDWYTPAELAKIIGKDDFTVRQHWCNGGRIEAEKDENGFWRIPRHEVERLLKGGPLGPKKER